MRVFHSLACCASWVVQAKRSTAENLVTTRLHLQSQGVEAFLSPLLSTCLHIVSSFSLAVLFILDLFWFLLWLKPWTVLPIFRKTMRYIKNECISDVCHIWRLSLERNKGIINKHAYIFYHITFPRGSRDGVIGMVTSQRACQRRKFCSIPATKKGPSLFAETSRSALVSIRPPVQWTSRTIFLAVKPPGNEASQSVPSIAVVKKVRSITELRFVPIRRSWRQFYRLTFIPIRVANVKA